jgi:hypothetical protein
MGWGHEDPIPFDDWLDHFGRDYVTVTVLGSR